MALPAARRPIVKRRQSHATRCASLWVCALQSSLAIEVLTGPADPLVVEMYLLSHARTDRDPAAAAFRDVVTRATALSGSSPSRPRDPTLL